MKKQYFFFSLLLLLALGSYPAAAQQKDVSFSLEELDIPYKKFVLDNGLTLIVHEDHKAPIVAINVWYHVGSKNEKAGKTGFAHLFEHLMFNGSENYNNDYFQAMESMGATDLNGTTNFDRTNYFQNVPLSALDAALWMESDRMGHFKGAISQERLDEQRGVVQNEKRQGENQPYGKDFDLLFEQSFPAGHPYSHSVIGSMEDLNAASLDDVKEWFQEYYGAANAVVVIAGDVNTEEAYQKAVQYFGHIPAGPPITKASRDIAKRTGEKRIIRQDRVPQSRIYMSWNVPEYGNPDAFLLDYVSGALASGKNSRLYKRLVFDEQIATSVQAFNYELEAAGFFAIYADVKPGIPVEQVEAAINEEMNRLLAEGLTEQEVKRIKTQNIADFIKGMERIGGFGGKSDILAENEVYKGDASFYKTRLQGMQAATAPQIKEVANRWLSDGKLVLVVNPVKEYTTAAAAVDRSKGLPALGTAAAVKFPDLQRFTLSNGLNVILAERKEVPLVRLKMMVDAGYAADQFGTPGTASLALNLMDEGTKSLSSLEFNDKLTMLGASLYTYSQLDHSFVDMTALKPMLGQSLDLYADVILNPAFNDSDFERLRKEQLVKIQREKSEPVQMALRVFPRYLYGEGHAYSNPFTGSGFETTVAALRKEDLSKFYSTWFKPNNATLIVTGDISKAELQKELEKRFAKWKNGEVPKKNLATVPVTKNRIYLMDKPGAVQSVIIAGHVAPAAGTDDDIAVGMMNDILGGQFTSRVNMKLREEKGWSYGASTLLITATGQRPFLAYAPVQSDKTQESMVELNKEIREYLKERKATDEEFKKVQTNNVLQLPGQWETLAAVEASAVNIVQHKYPDNYYQTYPQKVQDVKLAEVQKAANKIVKPDAFSWVVVGDRTILEEKLKALGFGDVVIINGDGEILEEKAAEKQLKTRN
ncbi:pitrilysin family protein [Cesiribacter sp. SM1]|uniref:M16 family metallopeptidase n=1 Tax=Cesiribacter sp. SM1 TaxID=2861196 RepID=UPI001CD7448C|nr:pitrilysin family protein [Cesiribacter sp. SM1]